MLILAKMLENNFKLVIYDEFMYYFCRVRDRPWLLERQLTVVHSIIAGFLGGRYIIGSVFLLLNFNVCY